MVIGRLVQDCGGNECLMLCVLVLDNHPVDCLLDNFCYNISILFFHVMCVC